MTNHVNALDHYLKLIASVFKGTELIRPWFVRRQMMTYNWQRQRREGQSGIDSLICHT
jgi:hypothetical protein